MASQAPAAHYGLAASPHGLIHQLWEHRHSGSQTVPSPARAAPGPGYPVLCIYGNAGCLLHKCHQHPGWDQWNPDGPSSSPAPSSSSMCWSSMMSPWLCIATTKLAIKKMSMVCKA